MLGLIFLSFEGFISQTYSPEVWRGALRKSAHASDGFEPLFQYDDVIAATLIEEISGSLRKSPQSLLEDFGTYLVTNPVSERVRRLLRFGGVDYEDFLHSLEDLSGRASLAVPDLNLPAIEVNEASGLSFEILVEDPDGYLSAVLLGILRALADDYGTLAILELVPGCQDDRGGKRLLTAQLVDMSHGEAREFQLVASAE